MSALTINLPDSLHGKLREFAAADGTSVERLVAAAAGEKLAAMLAGAAYLERGKAKGSRKEFERILGMVPDVPEESTDELLKRIAASDRSRQLPR